MADRLMIVRDGEAFSYSWVRVPAANPQARVSSACSWLSYGECLREAYLANGPLLPTEDPDIYDLEDMAR